MKTYLLVFYSNTGNSKFIADKLSNELVCDSKEIIPMFKNPIILFLLSLLSINIPTNISKENIRKYDEIIIIGPIWAGLLISPLRTFIKKSIKASKNIHFSVTCETKEEDKNSKYGYIQVLTKASNLGGKFFKNTAAFSTSLANTENKSLTTKLDEKIKLTEENYSEILKLRVKDFAKKIKSTL